MWIQAEGWGWSQSDASKDKTIKWEIKQTSVPEGAYIHVTGKNVLPAQKHISNIQFLSSMQVGTNDFKEK